MAARGRCPISLWSATAWLWVLRRGICNATRIWSTAILWVLLWFWAASSLVWLPPIIWSPILQQPTCGVLWGLWIWRSATTGGWRIWALTGTGKLSNTRLWPAILKSPPLHRISLSAAYSSVFRLRPDVPADLSVHLVDVGPLGHSSSLPMDARSPVPRCASGQTPSTSLTLRCRSALGLAATAR